MNKRGTKMKRTIILCALIFTNALLFPQTLIGGKFKMTLDAYSSGIVNVNIENVYSKFYINFYITKNIETIYDIGASRRGSGNRRIGTADLYSAEFTNIIGGFINTQGAADDREWINYSQTMADAIFQYISGKYPPESAANTERTLIFRIDLDDNGNPAEFENSAVHISIYAYGKMSRAVSDKTAATEFVRLISESMAIIETYPWDVITDQAKIRTASSLVKKHISVLPQNLYLLERHEAGGVECYFFYFTDTNNYNCKAFYGRYG
jgi:hypothetical protein